MNRDSTKPHSPKPPADAETVVGADASAGAPAPTHSKRAGPPSSPPSSVASMWLRTPEDVLARIPFALGFHPSDSLVVIAVNANGRSDLVVRTDLPAQDLSPPPPADLATPTPGPTAAADTEPAPAAATDTDRASSARASTLPVAAGGDAGSTRATAPPVVATNAAASSDAITSPAVAAAGAAASNRTAASPGVATDPDADRATTSPLVAGSDAAASTHATTAPVVATGADHAPANQATAQLTTPGHAARTAPTHLAGDADESVHPAAGTTVDTATAGFGRVTTDHLGADRAIPAQPGDDTGPGPSDDDWPDFAHQLAAAMVHNEARHAVLVAYTSSAELARRSTGILAASLEAAGIGLLDVLWVDGGRWRSLACHDRQCCPAEGRPYDARASRVAAESVYHGEVALSGEAELRRSIAPVRGLARFAMRRATARMDAEASHRYLRVEGEDVKIAETVRADGKTYVLRLVERYLSEGKPPTDDEVAWAAMYLYDVHVRDAAWLRMTMQTAQQHVQLWREIGRRALPPYHVAPLALLAFAAWLSGDGPLARCAVDRVLASDATYSMAHVTRDAVAAMVPPSVWPPDDWPAQSGEAGEPKQGQAD